MILEWQAQVTHSNVRLQKRIQGQVSDFFYTAKHFLKGSSVTTVRVWLKIKLYHSLSYSSVENTWSFQLLSFTLYNLKWLASLPVLWISNLIKQPPDFNRLATVALAQCQANLVWFWFGNLGSNGAKNKSDFRCCSCTSAFRCKATSRWSTSATIFKSGNNFCWP